MHNSLQLQRAYVQYYCMLIIFSAHIVLTLHWYVKYIKYKQECVMKSGIKVERNQGETTEHRIILIIDKWCFRAQSAVLLCLKIQLQKRGFLIFILTWQNKCFQIYIIASFYIQRRLMLKGYIHIQDSFRVLLLRWSQKSLLAVSLTVV